MRHLPGLLLTAMLALPLQGSAMPNQPLQVSARCIDNPGCVFAGEDLRIEIVISNTSAQMAGYPLAYMKRRGPTVILRDPVSGRSQPQRISLANRALRSVFTTIAPGQSIALDDVVRASQLRQFGQKIDLTAEIGVSATITVGTAGTTRPFEGNVTLSIAGRDVPPKPSEP